LIDPSSDPDAAVFGHQSSQPGNVQVGDTMDMPAVDPRGCYAQEFRHSLI
jgi:hypothetical protein